MLKMRMTAMAIGEMPTKWRVRQQTYQVLVLVVQERNSESE
ncbi:hypothetical protein [Brevibacillus formosus]|nr:hypothetical protein [Brevibacillus formosus]